MSMMSEFKEFAVKGNVLDMAVGVIIGGAFGKIVSSVVSDILMPNMDGKEFVRNLRREPELKDTPVIFITVCIDLEKDKGHETIEVDGIHYPGFAKPLHNARLLSLIRKTLNRRANSSSDDKSDEDPDE